MKYFAVPPKVSLDLSFLGQRSVVRVNFGILKMVTPSNDTYVLDVLSQGPKVD